MKFYNVLAVGLLLFSGYAIADSVSAYANGKRRVSPVIVDMNVSKNARYCGFRAGEEYTITWTTKSYETDINATLGIWDCDGINEFDCGRTWIGDYGERVFGQGEIVGYNARTTSEWTHTDGTAVVDAWLHDFNLTFIFPSNGEDDNPWSSGWLDNGADQIVVRWYQKVEGEVNSVSLLLGSEAGHQYGDHARRIRSSGSNDLNTSSFNPCAIE